MNFLRRLFTVNTAEEQTTQQQPQGSDRVAAVRRLSRYSRLIILLGIILIVGLWLLVWQQINYDYNRTINETSLETMNFAIAFEEHVRRIIADADKDLLRLKQAYERDSISSPLIAAYTENEGNYLIRNQIAISDEQGTLVISYNKRALATNISDREYFRVHRGSTDEGLYIGGPIQTMISGQTAIPLTRRINKPDGSFAGIVYTSLKTDNFLDFYKKMNFGEDQLITLTGLDGIVRARQSGHNLKTGQDLTNSALWKNMRILPAGTYIANATVDGIERIISYRVMPDYPLVFSIGETTKVALAEFEKRKQSNTLGASLLSLFIAIICGLLVDRFEKQRTLNAWLEIKIYKRTQQVEAQREELQAQNEELLAQEEELQAQNEQLRAQEEELQSQNEELIQHRNHLREVNVSLEEESAKRQAAQESLSQINAELEDKIIERMQDLRDVNAALQKEVLVRVKAEERIRAQAQLLDLAHDYIIVRDVDNKIIYWNRGAEAGYGWPAGEAIGQKTQSLLQTQFPVSAEYVWDSLLTKGYWEGELTHTRKDGRQIVVQSHQTLNKYDGNPVSILEINHDITAQKILDAELTRLDRLNTIGEMAASIGHEVRNPLTTVRGYLQMFQRKEQNAKYQGQIKTMIEELDRANFIISEFLSLAKNKAIDFKRYNMNDIVSALLPLIQADTYRTGHHLQIDMGDIPDVDLDEKEVRQLLLNLVRNGLEATPPGGSVTIKTALVADQVVLTVQDTGPGIPKEILDKLGTPFVTTKENGTGLGLPVCFRIADRHNAIIEVNTGSNGTTFNVKFNQPARN